MKRGEAGVDVEVVGVMRIEEGDVLLRGVRCFLFLFVDFGGVGEHVFRCLVELLHHLRVVKQHGGLVSLDWQGRVGGQMCKNSTHGVEVTNERLTAVPAEIFTDDNTEKFELLGMRSHGVRYDWPTRSPLSKCINKEIRKLHPPGTIHPLDLNVLAIANSISP